MSNFGELVKRANEKKKREEETAKETETSSAFESLVKKANSGKTDVATTFTDSKVNDWSKSASEVAKKAYDYLSVEGYKAPDLALESALSAISSS